MTNQNTNWGNFQGQQAGGFNVNPAGQQGGQQQAQPIDPSTTPAPAPQAAAPMPPTPQPATPQYPAPNPGAPMAGTGGTQAPIGQTGTGDPNAQQDPPGADPNYRFAANMANFTTIVKLPAHTLKFDEDLFINLLAGSISLSKDEKKKIIHSIPKLRQAQVDELVRIFEEERAKFIELSVKHAAQLKKLEKEHMEDWRDIEMEIKAESQQKEEESQVDDIKKQLGL